MHLPPYAMQERMQPPLLPLGLPCTQHIPYAVHPIATVSSDRVAPGWAAGDRARVSLDLCQPRRRAPNISIVLRDCALKKARTRIPGCPGA